MNRPVSGIAFVNAIAEIDRQEWQSLVACDNPFISYDYLRCLEDTGATGPHTAWQPMHLTRRDTDGRLIAAVPLYLKDDSWGEFVFDFAWAEAHHRHGINYYPKLVTAIPYTPVAGPRLLMEANCSPIQRSEICAAIQDRAKQLGASSWHILFVDEREVKELETQPLLLRKDCQFHWFNQSYSSFEHYLSTFRSTHRKKTRRERRRITEAGIEISTSYGHNMSASQWQQFYALYASTFHKRGRTPYFAPDFFTQLAASTDINIIVKWARRGNQIVAASLFFASHDTLYGRYWGCHEFVDGLHFELCYYQGIEHCIAHQLRKFDPGVQGEQK